MSSNVYHKQTNQHRTRRDRVVVIDGAAKRPGSRSGMDPKTEESSQRNFQILIFVIVFMVAVLFLSIKILEHLWVKHDRSVTQKPPVTKTVPTPVPAATNLVIPEPKPTEGVTAPAITGTPPSTAAIEVKDVEKIFRWGKVLEEAGESDGALARYREALDVEPTNIVVLAQIGRLTIKLGQYGEAVRALRQAIEISSDNPDVMNDLGVALTFNGQSQEAVTLYDRLLQEYPDYHAALFNKGYAMVQLRDYTQARPVLEQYIEKKPDDAMALGVMAVLELAEKQPDKALELLDKAISIKPAWTTPYLDAATISAGQGQTDRAISYLDRALEFASPADVYRQYQTEAFRAVRITEPGVALEKKIAAKAREVMSKP